MAVPAFEKVTAVNIAGVHHGIAATIRHMANRPDATILVTASGADAEMFERGGTGEISMDGMNRLPFRFDPTPIAGH